MNLTEIVAINVTAAFAGWWFRGWRDQASLNLLARVLRAIAWHPYRTASEICSAVGRRPGSLDAHLVMLERADLIALRRVVGESGELRRTYLLSASVVRTEAPDGN